MGLGISDVYAGMTGSATTSLYNDISLTVEVYVRRVLEVR